MLFLDPLQVVLGSLILALAFGLVISVTATLLYHSIKKKIRQTFKLKD